MSDGPGNDRIGPLEWLSRQLRIRAIRDVFSMVEVRRVEIVGLISLAVFYALAEGVGLSVLLPVLQYVESGSAGALSGGGPLWEWPGRLALALGLPLNLATLLVLAFIPVMLRQVAYYFNAWYSAVVSNRITVRMRTDTYGTMMAADPDFFTTRPQGELTGVVINQTIVAGQAVLQVIRLISVVLQILIYATLLAFLSPQLTVIAAIAGLLVSQLMHRNMLRTREFGAQVTRVAQQTYGAIIERISLARLVKMRAQEESETTNVNGLSEENARASIAMARIAALVEVTADPLLMFAAFITLYVGVTVLDMKLAALGMLLYVLTRLNSKTKEFNAIRQTIAGQVAGMTLVRDVTAQAKAASTIRSGATRFEGLRRSIVLDRVSFVYPGAETATLHEVDARIEAGSFTAIVGRSGAGKSSLVELLPRMRDVTSGAVSFDEVDVREFELTSLRRGIGYLTQDPMLFNDTLRTNLLYGVSRTIDDDELTATLDLAHASFVRELPQGLDTRLGDRGVRLSGGERQRIALARVLLEKPSLLILDEPTSALDSESEGYIQETLANLHGSTTIVVIAHRLATVVKADQLLVMENGRIVQRGTHRELAEADGPYKHLFESQLLK